MLPLLSRKDAMQLLGIGKTKFKSLEDEGEFRAVPIGTKKQYRPEDLEAFVLRQQEKA